MKNQYYRTQQYISSKVVKLLPWRFPEVIEGTDSLLNLPKQIKQSHLENILVITTAGFIRRGTLQPFFDLLVNESISFEVFTDIQPDPTVENIENGVIKYQSAKAQAIVAIGGGSVMDCAKAIGARIVRPNKSIAQMTGMFKVRKKLPTLYAVPTTAGTGSETTVAAVITDTKINRKCSINDLALMPDYAVLDPNLLIDLPPMMTAATGMDALTHAVEAYTNRYSSKESKEKAKKAVKLIFENLEPSFIDGKNTIYRKNMLLASFYAGQAFTKSYVGYVHAIAHGIGGLYHTPHGVANAVILPIVLKEYGEAIYKELAELATVIGIKKSTEQEQAKAFIQEIVALQNRLQLPNKITDIKIADIPKLAKGAMKEANPAYPVPVIWNEEKFISVIKKIKG